MLFKESCENSSGTFLAYIVTCKNMHCNTYCKTHIAICMRNMYRDTYQKTCIVMVSETCITIRIVRRITICMWNMYHNIAISIVRHISQYICETCITICMWNVSWYVLQDMYRDGMWNMYRNTYRKVYRDMYVKHVSWYVL